MGGSVAFIVAMALFTLAFVYYSKYQFIDGRAGKWHNYGLLMRTLFVVGAFTQPTWQAALLGSTISQLIFDIGINVIALGVSPLYVGTTSKMDIRFGKIKFYLEGVVLLVSIILIIFT